jgi:hypothetical protein
MSDLTGRSQNDTYKDLLHFENSNLGFDGTLRQIESGNGIGSSLSLATVGVGVGGTLDVAGITSFSLTPNVAGNEMWHAGNDGAGSGLDADTLQGNLPSEFIKLGDSPTPTGDWTFQGLTSLSRANDTELLRFIDTSNNLQMRAAFNTNLDFAFTPGSAGVFSADNNLFYDVSDEIWSTLKGFTFANDTAELYIGGGNLLAGIGGGGLSITIGTGDLTMSASAGILNASASGDVNLLSTAGNVDIASTTGTVVITSSDEWAGLSQTGGVTLDAETDISLTANLGQLVVDTGGDTIIASGGAVEVDATEEITLSGSFVQIDDVNGLALITADHTLATSTSSVVILDGGGAPYHAGFNGMPSVNFAASTSLLSANVGYKLNYTGAVVSALSISGDADILDGATWVGANLGTIPFTVDTTGITLNWLDGGGIAAPTGTRTIAVSGIFTITKRGTGVYDIWGAGIT